MCAYARALWRKQALIFELTWSVCRKSLAFNRSFLILILHLFSWQTLAVLLGGQFVSAMLLSKQVRVTVIAILVLSYLWETEHSWGTLHNYLANEQLSAWRDLKVLAYFCDEYCVLSEGQTTARLWPQVREKISVWLLRKRDAMVVPITHYWPLLSSQAEEIYTIFTAQNCKLSDGNSPVHTVQKMHTFLGWM